MKTTILLFHPHMDQSRVNKALAEAAKKAGFEVRDMYALYPDFKIDVPKEWYSSPALVKQYEDDVFTGNWAYNGGKALLDHEWLLAVTPGADKDAYAKDGRVHYTMPSLLRPYQATSILIKTKFMTPFISYNASNMSDAELAQRAQAYVEYLQQPELQVAERYGDSEK